MSSIRKSTIANFIGAAIPILVSLVTVPLYLAKIGDERFGLLSISWILIGYFGLLDLGLARATIHKLSQAAPASRPDVFWTSLWSSTVMASIAAAVVYLIAAPLLFESLLISAERRSELHGVFPWLAVSTGSLLLGGVFAGALEADRRFIEVNVLQGAGAAMTQILPVLAAYAFSPRLDLIIPAACSARILTTSSLALLASRRIDMGRIRPPKIDQLASLFSYGGWIGLSTIISPLLTSIDQILIGNRLGAAAVPFYSVPYSLTARLAILPAALTRTLFPTMSTVGSTERSMEKDFIVPLGSALTAVCCSAILLSPTFFELWLGLDFAKHAAPAAQILLIGMWFNCLAYLPVVRLQAIGRPDVPAKIHLIELVPYLALLIALVSALGIIGAAIASATRVTADCLLLSRACNYSREQMIALAPGPILLLLCLTVSQLRTGIPYDFASTLAMIPACGLWVRFTLKRLRIQASRAPTAE